MKKFRIVFIIILLLGINNSCELLFPEPAGQVVFWADHFGSAIDVYLDDEYKGTITTFYDSDPACESIGNVTLTLEPGVYINWHAEEIDYPYRSWNKEHTQEIIIQEDNCATKRLNNILTSNR